MVTIPGQFNGPPSSGNGGWVCGLIAEEWARRHGPGVVTSTLLQPPPLDTTLSWEDSDGDLRLLTAGGAVIATGTAGTFVAEPPPPVSVDEMQAGHDAYPGFSTHPFATCFTCGTARAPGDGLRVFTGAIEADRTAGPWHVHEVFAEDDGTVSVPVTWAGMDCPGGWTAGFPDDVLLLGRMTAEVTHRPRAGQTLASTGWLRTRDGRKRLTSTALYGEDGRLFARSEQVWISVA